MATAGWPNSDVEEMQTGGGWKVTVLYQQLWWGASPRNV